MALRTLTSKSAAALDEHLMSTGAYTIDQLMELAGLAVSQALHIFHPPSAGPRVLIACGPGNNGGDGLVAARHLHHFGYVPRVHYPKQGKADIYSRLVTQLRDLDVPVLGAEADFAAEAKGADVLVDSVFGFSFSGNVRDPFGQVIQVLKSAGKPVLAVDAPSSWDIADGPPQDGPGEDYVPEALISLTAPKPLVKWFDGRHFVGGRFLSKAMADKFEIDVPPYQGAAQIVEVDKNGKRI